MNTDDLLLIYARPPRRTATVPGTAITLDAFRSASLTEFDGPVLGMAAVDLIRSDVPTKGSMFCRLDRVFRNRGMVRELRETWTELANHVRARIAHLAEHHNDSYRQRALAEIAAISAPHRIAALPDDKRRGMVAFVPERDLVVRLSDIVPGPLPAGYLAPDDQVIAFEEARSLIGIPQPASYSVELRTIVLRSQLDDEFGATLTELSWAFYRRWQQTHDNEDLRRAYGLALEIHLGKGDVDDLCGVLPSRDFDAFVRTGAGTFLYRGPLEGDDGGPFGDAAHRLSLDDADTELAGSTAPVRFSLLPLRHAMAVSTPATMWCDLGPILRRVGRTEILARNAWLLTQDLLDERRQREAYEVTTEDLLETMIHCCAIYSMTDPWRARQARRNEWLLEAYETLHRVLELLIQSTDGLRRSYYTALDHWFGCGGKGADVARSLSAMVAVLESRPADLHRHDGPDPDLAGRAQLLLGLGRALLTMLRGGGRAEAYEDLIRPTSERFESTPKVVSRAADMTQPMDLLSVPFWSGFQRYAVIVDAIRRTRAHPIPVRDKIDQLISGIDQLNRGFRLIFAPLHQANILSCLYERTILDTRDLVSQLRGGAALEVELRTSSIAPDRDGSGIVFAVANVGSVAARDVEVELFVSEAFELLDSSFKQTLPHLGPGSDHRFRFAVRSVSDTETFPVRCTVSCAGEHDRQERTFEFVMRVTGVDSGQFHQRPNPYVFGLPLMEHRRFYGRRSELQQLLSHLADRRPQNVLLRGARRTGKTSLLYMVQAVLTDTNGRSGVRKWFGIQRSWHDALDSTRPVVLDLQSIDWPHGTPTATTFYQAVLGTMSDARLRSDESDRLLGEPSVTGTQFVVALRAILRNARGQRPVVLVDEFDILDRIAEKSEFYAPLRHAISTVQGVTWVVASALGLYKEARDYESPLFNVFKIVPLSVLDPEAARRLILTPWEAVSPRSRLRFADDAVETIIEEAGRYPYFIQLLCSEIVDYVNTTHTRYVQFKTVLQVIERQMMIPGSAAWEHFAYMWDRASGVGKLILLTLLSHPGAMDGAQLKATVRRHVVERAVRGDADPLGDYDESLLRLVVVDAVREIPGGGYGFGIPLFRRLLMHRGEREDLEAVADQDLAQDPPEAQRA
ncbi:ATP-binding protein [Virgisporangium ochraceum]|nr:ATP-binding protein [Virgisporangium ochraceum]